MWNVFTRKSGRAWYLKSHALCTGWKGGRNNLFSWVHSLKNRLQLASLDRKRHDLCSHYRQTTLVYDHTSNYAPTRNLVVSTQCVAHVILDTRPSFSRDYVEKSWVGPGDEAKYLRQQHTTCHYTIYGSLNALKDTIGSIHVYTVDVFGILYPIHICVDRSQTVLEHYRSFIYLH